MLIKICGVKTPDIAAAAAQAGADFIGIIFHPPSRHAVSVPDACAIARAALANGAKPVGVFVEQSAEHMQKICEETGISVVQLHGDKPQRNHVFLPDHYQRFYVIPVSPEGTIVFKHQDIPKKAELPLQSCQPSRDYILFDNTIAGKGKPFDWVLFKNNLHDFKEGILFKKGLAGGLHAGNVQQAFAELQPALMDVSSGVEDARGQKDIARICLFIKTIRNFSTSFK